MTNSSFHQMEICERTCVFNVCSLLAVYLCLLKLCDSTGSAVKGPLTLATSAPTAGSSIYLEVVHACDTVATLVWGTTRGSSANLSSPCDLTYYRTDEKSAEIVDILFDSHPHTIRLFNLTRGQSYTAFIACGASIKTNQVSFFSDKRCEGPDAQLNQTATSSTEIDDGQTPVYFHASTFDMVQWPVAAAFAVLGIIIAAVVAFYMWKKYQRRQRILRIFRQGQNDPFQALYSPTQDSYSF